jgi:excisionase family DNA binding protein
MNKREAAAYLGISTRALERHAMLGHVSVRHEKGPTGDVAIFDEKELRQLKAQIDERRAPRPFVVRDVGEGSATSEGSAMVRASDTGLSVLAAIMEAARSASALPPVSIGEKIMLTLTDASALTSLSVGHLRDAIHSGKLKGKIIGRGYKIKRGDLDAYIKRL